MTEIRETSDQDYRELYERLLCGAAIHVEKRFIPGFDGSFTGTIALPKGFAENTATVIATAGSPRSLLLLEEGHWCAITTELLNRTKTGAQPGFSASEALRRLFLGNATELDISPRRTVELPNHLLDYAGIDQGLRQSWHGQAIELLPAGDAKFL
jgi:hypothetical protein